MAVKVGQNRYLKYLFYFDLSVHISGTLLSNFSLDSQNYYFSVLVMIFTLHKYMLVTFSSWVMKPFIFSRNSSWIYNYIILYISLWRYLWTNFQDSFFVVQEITIPFHRNILFFFISKTFHVWETTESYLLFAHNVIFKYHLVFNCDVISPPIKNNKNLLCSLYLQAYLYTTITFLQGV